jgi:hypothetical protein
MRNLAFVTALLALTPFTAQAASYFVYCANDKIEVDSRNFEQMKSARGSGICQLGSFDYLSDAQSFAQKNFGGPGGKCSCR